MNELSEMFRSIRDGDCIVMEPKLYEVAPEDSFHEEGLFFSNTAKREENPNGERFCAIYNITIDSNGAVVMIHGKTTPFLFCKCRSITMKNICFDHYRPTMSEFTVVNCAARYSVCGDDVIRYEPVVPDESSVTPVHKKLVLKNNRFIRDNGRAYGLHLNYLDEAVIEGNTANVKLKIQKEP